MDGVAANQDDRKAWMQLGAAMGHANGELTALSNGSFRATLFGFPSSPCYEGELPSCHPLVSLKVV